MTKKIHTKKIAHNRQIKAMLDGALKKKAITKPNHAVLYALAEHSTPEGFCFPTYETIANGANITRRSAIRRIKSLEELKLVAVNRNFDGASYGYPPITNSFTLNVELIRLLCRFGKKNKNTTKKSKQELSPLNDENCHLNTLTGINQSKDKKDLESSCGVFSDLKNEKLSLMMIDYLFQGRINLEAIVHPLAYLKALVKRMFNGVEHHQAEQWAKEQLRRAETEKRNEAIRQKTEGLNDAVKALISWGATGAEIAMEKLDLLAKHNKILSRDEKSLFNKFCDSY